MTNYKDSHIKWKFENIEELVDYVANKLDIKPQSKRFISGKGSQINNLKSAKTDERRSITFRNPILNQITSPHGELVIGSKSFNVRARRLNSSKPSFHSPGNNFTAATELECYEDFSGLEFCQSDDGKMQTYTDGDASIMFRSYRDSGWVYSEMGTEITTIGLNFEAANINSRYYGEAFQQTCDVYKYDDDSDFNDNYLDEYEWFIGSPLIRVESLCRVQWNGRRFSGVVSAGNECFQTGTPQPWPIDIWPDNWPPLSVPDPIQSLSIFPRSLTFISKPSSPIVTKFVTINSTHTSPVTVTIGQAIMEADSPEDATIFERPTFGGVPKGTFSNVSGQLTIPPNGNIQIGITFSGESGLGSIFGSLPITWDSGQVDITLKGTLVQEALATQ